jgi:hypothetical protein
MASASLIKTPRRYPPIQPLFTDKGQQNRLFIDPGIGYLPSHCCPPLDGFSFVDDAHHYVKTPLTCELRSVTLFTPSTVYTVGLAILYIDSGPRQALEGH